MRLPHGRFTKRYFVAGAACISLVFLLATLSRPTAISEDEATRLAEEFIVTNGYTDLPADKSRLSPEPIVFTSSVEDELRLRRDQLERKADEAFRGEDWWMIYFRYKQWPDRDSTKGGGMVMDLKGNHIQIMHQDAY